MITLKNVTKYYPMRGGKIHYVFRDVSLEIPGNQSIGILGPNGSGKSTLLRMIGGAEAPNSGTITTTASVSWPLGLRSSFQGSMTGRQNILFVCQINGLNMDETREVVDSVLKFSELEDYFDMPVKSYSSDMRARLGFGLSINFDFDYYLIDELTSVGDAIFRKKAKQEFKKIKKTSSLIYVTHNLESLRASCEKALFLHDGTLTYYQDINDGIEAYMEYIQLKTVTPGVKISKKSAKKAAKKGARKAAKKAAKRASWKTAENKSAEPPHHND